MEKNRREQKGIEGNGRETNKTCQDKGRTGKEMIKQETSGGEEKGRKGMGR